MIEVGTARGGLHGACTQVRVSRAGRLDLHPSSHYSPQFARRWSPLIRMRPIPLHQARWRWHHFFLNIIQATSKNFMAHVFIVIYIYLYYYISICSIFIQCLTPLESIFYLYSIIQHQAIHLGFRPQAVPGEHVINWKPSTNEWRCCRWLERSHGWLKPMVVVYHSQDTVHLEGLPLKISL